MSIHKRRSTCRLCQSAQVELVFALEPSALAEAYLPLERAHEAEERYPMDVFLCRNCGGVQMLDVIDAGHLFRDYAYRSATSPGLQKHFADYAAAIIQRFAPSPGSLVVDCGSNDGTLLRYFKNAGLEVQGVDPARDIAASVTAAGIPTLPTFMNEETASKIVDARGKARIITANNVLAHAEEPGDILNGIRAVLSDDGVLVFEVSYLPDILTNMVFDWCLPPGSQIITKTGVRAIETVVIGDEVMTHLGRFRKVTKTFRHRYEGPLRSIFVYGHSDPLRLTPEHPVYVRRLIQASGSGKYKYGLGEFVEARCIQIGDRILKPAMTDEEHTRWLTIESPSSGHGRSAVKTTIRVTFDLLRVFGYYLAEGYYYEINKDRGAGGAIAEFAFGKSDHEKGLANDCAERLHRLGVKGSLRLTKFGWHVRTFGPMARLLFREFGTGAAHKFIPTWIMLLGPEMLHELLQGYVLGDGYLYRGESYWRATTVSPYLAQDIALAANKLGFSVIVNRSKRPWKEKVIANNPKPTTSAHPLYDILIRLHQQRTAKVSFESGYQHGSIKRIEDCAYCGEVYNLEVEEDNSYVAVQGAVHNCYHEHGIFYTATSLQNLFARHGLEIFDAERIPTKGGSLRGFAAKAGMRKRAWRLLMLLTNEHRRQLATPVPYERYLTAVNRQRAEALLHLAEYKARGRTMAGYGASATTTTLLHHFKLAPYLDYLVDDNDRLHGLYSPGYKLPVLAPAVLREKKPDVIVILAWRFAKEIMEKNRWYTDQGGLWVIPLPVYREVPGAAHGNLRPPVES